MSTLQEIEKAIDKLPRGEVYELGAWLDQRLNGDWDTQIENDVKDGRLDAIAEEALREHRAGKTKNFPDREE